MVASKRSVLTLVATTPPMMFEGLEHWLLRQDMELMSMSHRPHILDWRLCRPLIEFDLENRYMGLRMGTEFQREVRSFLQARYGVPRAAVGFNSTGVIIDWHLERFVPNPMETVKPKGWTGIFWSTGENTHSQIWAQ